LRWLGAAVVLGGASAAEVALGVSRGEPPHRDRRAQRPRAEEALDIRAPVQGRLRRVHLEPQRSRRRRLPRGSRLDCLRPQSEDRQADLDARLPLGHTYDFQDSPILATEKIHGARTEVVIGAGKSGEVVAFRAGDGKRLWTLEIGKHNRYQSGPLPKKPVVYCPGSLGGVLTPMAEARNVLYVPWIDLCFKGSATGLVRGGPVPR
jgi:hypothetical protein